MRVDLEGRVALVVGGPEGRSHAIADLLDANGARVTREMTAAAEQAVRRVVERFGTLDILVHVDAATPGAMAFSRAAATVMAAQGKGRIVHIGSVGGIVPVRGREDCAAANAGMFAHTRAMALELARRGVLVNAIAALWPDEDPHAHAVAHCPLGRLADDAEVGNATLFLLAPASSYVTGHVMTIDGGWSAGFARDF